jgi:hypothetical protein
MPASTRDDIPAAAWGESLKFPPQGFNGLL